jgi:endonuclease/exonuclease/phosphatase family metal-dependent hydrolase
MRVLTWNLKHGRAVPSAGRNLFDEFASALAGWEWDVALLQEVPPWWPEPLAARTHAVERHVLTSRNAGLAVRKAIAQRWPDVAKSNGGGANAILVRHPLTITEHRTRRLSLLPERRWIHAVLLSDPGIWMANVHLQADLRQVLRAAAAIETWAGRSPAVLGGDFNLVAPSVPGFRHAGGHDVDHIYVRDFGPAGATGVLDRGHLSDHAPVVVAVTPAVPSGSGPTPRSPVGPTPPSHP